MRVPPLTWLYASAARPDVVTKAIASDADVVIVDLEDSVAPSAKASARAAARAALVRPAGKPVYVRINGVDSEWWQDDLDSLRGTAIAGLVVSKVEAAGAMDAVSARLWRDDLSLHCLIETARGVEHVHEIASHPRVVGISLGEADLRAELGVTEDGLDWCRSRVVVAAAAAGLPRPPQSVYTDLHDLEGLRASCERGRALGHLGRTAVHPLQLPVIVEVYRPGAGEVAEARAIVAAFESGSTALVVGQRFLDAPALRSARLTLELAAAYGAAPGIDSPA